jgi:hypothetical protein
MGKINPHKDKLYANDEYGTWRVRRCGMPVNTEAPHYYEGHFEDVCKKAHDLYEYGQSIEITKIEIESCECAEHCHDVVEIPKDVGRLKTKYEQVRTEKREKKS